MSRGRDFWGKFSLPGFLFSPQNHVMSMVLSILDALTIIFFALKMLKCGCDLYEAEYKGHKIESLH